MQTVRRYAYLVAIGLVAALVFSTSAGNILSQTFKTVSQGGEFSAPGLYLLYLIAALIIAVLFKHALSGVPKMFRERVRWLRRRLTLALLLGGLGMIFFLA